MEGTAFGDGRTEGSGSTTERQRPSHHHDRLSSLAMSSWLSAATRLASACDARSAFELKGSERTAEPQGTAVKQLAARVPPPHIGSQLWDCRCRVDYSCGTAAVGWIAHLLLGHDQLVGRAEGRGAADARGADRLEERLRRHPGLKSQVSPAYTQHRGRHVDSGCRGAGRGTGKVRIIAGASVRFASTAAKTEHAAPTPTFENTQALNGLSSSTTALITSDCGADLETGTYA